MKINNVKVYPICSPKSNNPVVNQFDIVINQDRYFQSYRSIIVYIPADRINKKIILDTNKWNYSRTTSKYRNVFLGETTIETQKKIKSGEYVLDNLN